MSDQRDDRKTLYTAADLDGVDHLDSQPQAPFVRSPSLMYTQRPWTSASTPGFRPPRKATPSPSGARGRAAGSVGRLRPCTHRGYDSDHPRVRGDVGQERVHRQRRGHGAAVRRHRPARCLGVHDHERRGAAGAGGLHRRREEGADQAELAGTTRTTSSRSSWSATPSSIPPAQPAHRRRHHRLHGRGHAALQLDLDLRLPYAGSPCWCRSGLHPRRRREYVRAALERGLDVDAFAPRLSFFFGIGMISSPRPQAARCPVAVVADHGGIRPAEPQVADAAHPLPDLRRLAAGSGPLQQHRARPLRR